MEVDSTTINSTQSLHAEIEREIISDFLERPQANIVIFHEIL